MKKINKRKKLQTITQNHKNKDYEMRREEMKDK